MECIILAGGLGTRLRSVIGEAPKCMAPVAGKPFLHYLLLYLERQGTSRVILSLGYSHAPVLAWLREHERSFSLRIDYVIEDEPLGTGGGMALALAEAKTPDVLVCNGDTLFDVDAAALCAVHRDQAAAVTLALKPMTHFERYGVVQTDEKGRVVSFEEKRAREHGLINGGIYVVNREYLLSKNLPPRFSLEQDFLERFVAEGRFYSVQSDAYFLDIGVPEDYDQAQQDFPGLFLPA